VILKRLLVVSVTIFFLSKLNLCGITGKANALFKFYLKDWYQRVNTCCGYKITRLILEHFLFKKLHIRNVVTLKVLLSPIPAPLHANLPLLEAVLQVVFW